MLDDQKLVTDIVELTADVRFDRQNRAALVRTFVKSLLSSPSILARGSAWVIRKIWMAKADLIAAHGEVNKLSFFIHNFMDACALDKSRVDACTFMAVTSDGPISMCLHNAKRDAFILPPLRIADPMGEQLWDPLSGRIEASDLCRTAAAVHHSPKTAKGRLKGLGHNRRSKHA